MSVFHWMRVSVPYQGRRAAAVMLGMVRPPICNTARCVRSFPPAVVPAKAGTPTLHPLDLSPRKRGSAAAYGSRLFGRDDADVGCPIVPYCGCVLHTLAHVAGGELYGLDDFRIRRAAAEIAGKIVADRVVVGIRMRGDQLARHQDEAGGAEAALKGAAFDEGLLDRIELAAGVE